MRLLDPAPHSIVAPYPRRDDETTSDWVFVELDSRHDRRTAFSFGLNPRGVQVDGVWFGDTEYDTAWNAVWQGAARIDADGALFVVWTQDRHGGAGEAFRNPARELAAAFSPTPADTFLVKLSYWFAPHSGR